MQARCGKAALALLFSLPVYSADLNDDFIRAAQRGDLPECRPSWHKAQSWMRTATIT